MLDSFKKITQYGDIALAAGLIAILMVLLFPVAPGLLDVLLAFSIAISIVILMNTLFINKSLRIKHIPNDITSYDYSKTCTKYSLHKTYSC
jgi:flagellar biosynthesis protein FlhA